MDAAPHHEGGRPGGLQEDLGDEQRGDGTCGDRAGEEAERSSPEAEQAHRRPRSPCRVRWPEALGPKGQRVSGTPELVAKQEERVNRRNWAPQVTLREVPKRGL